jgi:hypothetical protein
LPSRAAPPLAGRGGDSAGGSGGGSCGGIGGGSGGGRAGATPPRKGDDPGAGGAGDGGRNGGDGERERESASACACACASASACVCVCVCCRREGKRERAPPREVSTRRAAKGRHATTACALSSLLRVLLCPQHSLLRSLAGSLWTPLVHALLTRLLLQAEAVLRSQPCGHTRTVP